MQFPSSVEESESDISLLIETRIKDDQIVLFGFISQVEKQWFIKLCSVQGVGQKAAMAIISAMSYAEFLNALLIEDNKKLQSAPGIGNRIARRIVTELKDKFADVSQVPIGEKSHVIPAFEDAITALKVLGIEGNRARLVVNKIADKNMTTEEIVKAALHEIS